MLHYALVFFVIALVAALLGFGNVAGLSAQFGYLFAVIAVIMLLVGLLGGRRLGPRSLPRRRTAHGYWWSCSRSDSA